MLHAKNLDSPDEKVSFDHGEVRVVELPGVSVARAELAPGWRWRTDVKPLAGTDSCQTSHSAYVVSGRLHVAMDDGTEIELGPGDAHVVSAEHDAWVVGDAACVTIDFTPSAATGHAGRCPCGVEFRVASTADLDHLVAAIQQHAAGSHGHQLSRDEVLDGVSGGRE